MYPVEYNVYSSGSTPLVSYEVNDAGVWEKKYKVLNTQGSVAEVLVNNGSGVADVRDYAYYEPYGAERYSYSNGASRTGFIGREKDKESDLGDHGVRKYDYEIGRFPCPDPMWGSFLNWNPYQYSRNNPILRKDDNGYYDLDQFGFAWDRLPLEQQERIMKNTLPAICKATDFTIKNGFAFQVGGLGGVTFNTGTDDPDYNSSSSVSGSLGPFTIGVEAVTSPTKLDAKDATFVDTQKYTLSATFDIPKTPLSAGIAVTETKTETQIINTNKKKSPKRNFSVDPIVSGSSNSIVKLGIFKYLDVQFSASKFLQEYNKEDKK